MSESVESFNEIVRGVGDFNLDDDCATLEHQVLKDSILKGERRSHQLDAILAKDTINIFTKEGRLAIRYLAEVNGCGMYLTEESRLLVIRGSFLIDPAQPPSDPIGYGVVQNLFESQQIANQEVVVSTYSSVPVVASENLLIHGGYVAYQLAYTQEQMGILLSLNGDVNAENYTYTPEVNVLGKSVTIVTEDALRWSRFPITEVSIAKYMAE